MIHVSYITTTTHEKNKQTNRVEVCGVFRAVDAKQENVVISNLDSGIGVVPTALVRWSDILSITTTTTDDDMRDETEAAAA